MLRGPIDCELLHSGENLECVISLYICIKTLNLEKFKTQYCHEQCLIFIGNNYLIILRCGITQRKRKSQYVVKLFHLRT